MGYDDDHKNQVKADNFNTPSAPAKKPKQSLSGSDMDWKLLVTEQHSQLLNRELRNALNLRKTITHGVDNCKAIESVRINTNSVLFPYIRIIHFTLHLLYEELKLNTVRYKELPLLAKFLNYLANSLGLKNYSVYYWKDFAEYCYIKSKEVYQMDLKNVIHWSVMSEQPYSIMQHIYDMSRGVSVLPYPFIPNVNPRSKDIVQVIFLFFL